MRQASGCQWGQERVRVQKQEAESKDNQDEINPKQDRLKGNKTKQKNQKQNKQTKTGWREERLLHQGQAEGADRSLSVL